MRKLKVVWKIHAVETVDGYLKGEGFGSCNNVFYETEEEAIQACKGYLKRANQTTDGFVVFKSALFVELQSPPINVVRMS